MNDIEILKAQHRQAIRLLEAVIKNVHPQLIDSCKDFVENVKRSGTLNPPKV